jgi:hypothetical protein
MNVKPRNLKVSGLPRPRRARWTAAKRPKLDQAGLIRVKRQRVFPQSLAHRIPESSGIGLILEANDHVVGVSYDDHVTRR